MSSPYGSTCRHVSWETCHVHTERQYGSNVSKTIDPPPPSPSALLSLPSLPLRDDYCNRRLNDVHSHRLLSVMRVSSSPTENSWVSVEAAACCSVPTAACADLYPFPQELNVWLTYRSVLCSRHVQLEFGQVTCPYCKSAVKRSRYHLRSSSSDDFARSSAHVATAHASENKWRRASRA